MNPVVQAIVSGKAPQQARLAAARGMLPLAQSELIEVLVALRESAETEISEAAIETLASQTEEDYLVAAKGPETSLSVLAYLATDARTGRAVYEAAILNTKTPDDAIASLARSTQDGSLLELISINQQRMVRAPAIIDAILENSARTADAERRARETRQEFFEKERGARQIAEELRARGKSAAAEFIESADLTSSAFGLSADDLWLIAEHIEVSDAEIDESWLPSEHYEELALETAEQQNANLQRVIQHEKLEVGNPSGERVSLIRRIMMMTPKDRLKLAMKGDREARGILIRDSNKVVCCAVINNPRVSEQEVENIAAMRTVAAEALRLISMNRAWARQYSIIHALARNPRTPIPTTINILPRIRTKDLMNLAQNRNVSEQVRRHSQRLGQARSGGK
ncbi:MAG TPA: hypothetical protein VGN86_08165 [Pyrinomonadaceae bacterium]|jgi:hypothetical protein|nr:hypothetical protein [Pyrinomonadaceae bacterium]